jgi:hypothetical protein
MRTRALTAAATLAIALIVGPAVATDPVARGKGIPVKDLEPGLDHQSLDTWLREHVWRGAVMSWHVIDCRAARGEIQQVPSDTGDCVEVVVKAPQPPVHASEFQCQIALRLRLPPEETEQTPVVAWIGSRIESRSSWVPPGDWVRAQRLEDIESRVRECDEAIRAAVEKEERFLRSMDRQAYLGWLALAGGPLIVVFGSLYLGTIVADRVERSGGSLKPAIAILGLGAAGTLLGAWSLAFLLDGFERLVFSTHGIYAMEGGVKGWLTLVLDLALWVPATLLVVLAMLFAIWRTRRARKVQEGGRR